MKSQQAVHAAEQEEQCWHFEVPPPNLRGKKMQLLTIGRVSVYGVWQGGLGEYFVGWAPLLAIPKDIPATVFQAVSYG